jgi:hypothetical protein
VDGCNIVYQSAMRLESRLDSPCPCRWLCFARLSVYPRAGAVCFLPIPAPDPVPVADAAGADAPEEGPPTVNRNLTAVGLEGGAGVSPVPFAA